MVLLRTLMKRFSVRLSETPVGEIDALRLCSSNVASIGQIKHVKGLGYDRDQVKPGILHLGMRDMYRVHQADYLNDVIALTGQSQWGTIAVGTNDSHRRACQELQVQDGLFTLVEKSFEGSDIKIVGSLVKSLYAPTNSKDVFEWMANPEIKIIQLTIKESNYCFNEDYTELNLRDARIQYDLYSQTPRTPAGLICKGLQERVKRKAGPITIVSCDNMRRSGEMTRTMVTAFAMHKKPFDSDLVKYLEQDVRFPSTVCDRICHTDPASDFEALQQLGLRDNVNLTTEKYKQWVVEDDFAADRPPYEEVGVQLVKDSTPYENIKLRLNYGMRLSVAIISTCIGINKFEDAMADPLVSKFARQYLDEVTAGVGEIPIGLDLEAYKADLCSRIATPKLRYQMRRVVEDCSKKMKMEWQPVLESLGQQNQSSRMLALAFAAWMQLLAGNAVTEVGDPISILDVNKDILKPAANRALQGDPEFLFNSLFGKDEEKIAIKPFENDVISAIKSLQMRGVRATLETWVN